MNYQKTQIFYIHWWMTFKSKQDYLNFLKNREISIFPRIKRNNDYLDKSLWEKFEIIRPRMPMQDDAKYDEWKIHFERHFEYLNDNIILIWSSLWWIFLSKYLSENLFPRKIISVYIICAPFDDSLDKEDLAWWFELWEDLSMIYKNCSKINFMFSKDDDCVSIWHCEKYKKKLPDANYIVYESKNWHFKIETFPEIVEMIKNDLNFNFNKNNV